MLMWRYMYFPVMLCDTMFLLFIACSFSITAIMATIQLCSF